MNQLERRSIQRLVDQADDLGLGEHVPQVMRDYLLGDHGGNGGARAWAETHPDGPETFGCCPGNDLRGPEHCNCWVPEYDLEQQPPRLVRGVADVKVRAGGMCGDCAYRKPSPERRDKWMEESLMDLAETGEAFFCHSGMRRPVRWRHPDGRVVAGSPADYQPPMVAGMPFQADGSPGLLCAGWSHHSARASQVPYPDWLLALDDQLRGGQVLPGGMIWQDPPPPASAAKSNTRGIKQNRLWRSGSQRAPVPSNTPMPPISVREQIYQVLRATPGRWARVHDGGWPSATSTGYWFRKRRPMQVEVTVRRDGLTVATFVRYHDRDVIA